MKLSKTIKAIACAGAALALAATLGACSSNADSSSAGSDANSTDVVELSGNVSTNGSTSMEKVIGSLGEAFMAANPGVTITYDATGSGTGIESASNGSCDLGLASRDLKSEETGLTSITIALDGIAVVVNADCGVDNLTLDQVSKIFTGEITNWSEVGGADLEISCIGREAGSGTRDGFESITGTTDACQYRQELTSTGDVITTVAQNPNAIGYASLASVKDTVKALAVEGVTPSEETVKDGSYLVQRPFVLVTKEGVELSAAAQDFFNYITSAEANEIIAGAGVVSAN